MKINTNIVGLRAMTSATKTERLAEATSKRLSSGLRINSAKDDPAGIAVSTRTQMQSDGTKMASQNSLNAISVVQTAAASMGEVHNMLQRMRELSVQAASATYDSSDRYKIQTEIDELMEEINSNVDKTQYNAAKLLNGHCGINGSSKESKIVQVSDYFMPGDYEFNVNANATSSVYTPGAPAGGFPDPALEGSIMVNGVEIKVGIEDTAEEVCSTIKDMLGKMNLKVELSGADPNSIVSITSEIPGAAYPIDITSENPLLLDALGFSSASSIQGSDANVSMGTGLENARYTIDGNRISIDAGGNKKMVLDIDPALADNSTVKVAVKDSSLIFHTGANRDISISVTIGEVTTASLGIDRISCMSQERAAQSITMLDNAISNCSLISSKLGSYENRLQLVNTNLESADASIQKTLSRVFDTDMALELAEMSKQKIITQSSTAMLVQANQRPHQVLKLIQ